MGEKRKPALTMLLKKQGKKPNKVELFKASLFKDSPSQGYNCKGRYRLRLDGIWYPKGERVFMTIYEFRDLLWRSLFRCR